MAAFDHFTNMYDVAFKPRLLRTLVKDHLPDEKHPFSNPLELSRVVSLIKIHSLLSESVTESMDLKQVQTWKSAVTSWVDRILTLVSNSVPDKCWAGISLLGVTCQECSSDRFVESYSEWFQKLLPFLQSPADSHLVRVASCASISDLFSRLSGFPKLKKEGSSCAVKVIQPALKLLNDDNSEAIWEGALHVLCTIIISFPFSVHRHYDSVESAIALKLFSGGCSPNMLKKLAHCLALLPKSKGDEETWSMMMQKILVLINDQLNSAFQGLEEESIRNEVIRLLVLPGKHLPPPLGGYILTEEASKKATKRSEKSLTSNVSTLMFGCCTMLTNSYPVKVNVPVRLLLALVDRILMVNGSLPQMSLPFMTAKQQENICSELPVLHSSSLELLTAIIKAMGSQLLPHAASIVRIITKYFKICALPELRIKVYSITRTLLISMGVGMALCLGREVINNAIIDLSTIENKSGSPLNGSNLNASTGALLLPSHRKRKHSSAAGSLQEHDEGSGLGMEVPKNSPLTPISLRVAALEALEALITMGGSLRSEQWRSEADNLVIVTAMNSFKEGSVFEEISMFQPKEPDATTTDLQLAALRALLASFLSFARGRPQYLGQGLELFRRGKQQTGTKLAEFCAHALLALEVFIHPRALPLVDYNCANHNSFDEAQSNFQDDYVVGQNSTPFDLPQSGHDPPDSAEYLHDRWLENGKEATVSLVENKPKYTEELSGASRDNDPRVLSMNLSSGAKIQERSDLVSEAVTYADVEMRGMEDEIILVSDQPGDSAVQFQEPISSTSIPVPEACGSVATEVVSLRMVSDCTVPHHKGSDMESGQGTSVNNGVGLASPSSSLLQRTSDSNETQEFALKLDHSDSLADEDVFPDIVDADPDSDSE